MAHWIDTIPDDCHRIWRWAERNVTRLAKRTNDLYLWPERVAGRRQLLALDDRLLKDIGISRADALKEASKPFWRK